MTERKPDKRERNRLEKIEKGKQKLRYIAAEKVCEGLSYREAAEYVGRSHMFVAYWVKRLLDKKTVYTKQGDKEVPETVFKFKEGYRALLASKKPGVAPGKHPKVDEIADAVVKVKMEKSCEKLGAKKIGLISKVKASAPTVAKALRLKGFAPASKPRARHSKRYCSRYPNECWDIDFIQIGTDIVTGKKVEALSVVDDHSRSSFSTAVTVSPTTQFVISVLSDMIRKHGKPKIIRSDHGCQWYSPSSGESKFDEWCEQVGIRHVMASIRTPEENGKVERLHGSIRRELDLPEKATLDEYHDILESYRTFYNKVRPHCSLDYRTPYEVYYKTYELTDDLPL